LATAVLLIIAASMAFLPGALAKYVASADVEAQARVAKWTPTFIGTLDDGYYEMTEDEKATYREGEMFRLLMTRNTNLDYWLPADWFKGVDNSEGEVAMMFDLWAEDKAIPAPNAGWDTSRNVEFFTYRGLVPNAFTYDLEPDETWNWDTTGNEIPASWVPAAHVNPCTHLAHVIRWRSFNNVSPWLDYNQQGTPSIAHSTTAYTADRLLNANEMGASYYRDVSIYWIFTQID